MTGSEWVPKEANGNTHLIQSAYHFSLKPSLLVHNATNILEIQKNIIIYMYNNDFIKSTWEFWRLRLPYQPDNDYVIS